MSRVMYGRKLLKPSSDGWSHSPTTAGPRLHRFYFNDPRATARTSVDAAAQVGARLAPFRPDDLELLDPDDRVLGMLLRLTSVSREPLSMSLIAREWSRLIVDVHPRVLALGPVLAPMMAIVDRLQGREGDQSPLSYAEIQPLVAQLGGSDRGERLIEWTAEVIAAGARLITDLIPISRSRPEIDLPQITREALTDSRSRHARDIVLAGDRIENGPYLKLLRSLSSVEKGTDFIYEPEPGLVRIRAWSEEPLEPLALVELGSDTTDIEMVDVLDDTVM